MNNEEKIVTIKVYEEDYERIKAAIISSIFQIKKNIENPNLDEETKNELQKEITMYRMLLSSLKTCKLYNE